MREGGGWGGEAEHKPGEGEQGAGSLCLHLASATKESALVAQENVKTFVSIFLFLFPRKILSTFLKIFYLLL